MQQSIQKRIQKPAHRADRRGATLVEAVICILAFLTLVLGMLDLGLTVSRYNTVAEAARLGARMAIAHGSKAPTAAGYGGPWTGIDNVMAIKAKIAPLLEAQGVLNGDIGVTVAHTDGSDSGTADNNPGDTVTVSVSVPHVPLMTFIFGTTTGTPPRLTGTSTMVISH